MVAARASDSTDEGLGGFDRDSYVLSSKVGRVLDPNDQASDDDDIYVEVPPYDVVFDFSRDGVLRSVEESIERLGLERLDIALIHDPDDHWEQAIGEAFPTLAELRSQGVVGAIGAGMNQWEMQARFAREGEFDCFLLAGQIHAAGPFRAGRVLSPMRVDADQCDTWRPI